MIRPIALIARWIRSAPRAFARMRQDVDAVVRNDPAARTRVEVVLAYPGLHAIWLHRAAHDLWRHDFKLVARLVSHGNRFVTGVEIHPGARIGHGVFIDHGMGLVVGETATVGDECLLYKGVVLGGTTLSHGVRHPQLGRGVVVGSNACVLGAISVGDGARIGSGSVVIRSVPPGATVVGVPGRLVPTSGDRAARLESALDHANLPDPVSEMIRSLAAQNERLRARLEAVERRLGVEPSHDPDPMHDVLGGAPLPPSDGG